MALEVRIKGLKFRSTDGNLSPAAQAEILRKRLSSPAGIQSLRAGDGPGLTYKYMGMRQPIDLETSVIDGVVSAPADPSNITYSKAITYVNLLDAREFARRLSKLTDRKFRVCTEGEFEQAQDQLLGIYHNWTETPHRVNSGAFVLRCLGFGVRKGGMLSGRYKHHTIRLAEDIAA